MGSFLKLAFNEVSNKADCMKNNYNFFLTELKFSEMSVQEFCLKEVELNVADTSIIENDYKDIKNEKTDHWQIDYLSFSR